MAELEKIKEALIAGKAEEVKKLTEEAIGENVPVKEVLENGLIGGMNVIGTRFKANEIYIPEVLIAARAMHAGMAILEPLLAKAGIEPVGNVIVGTVKGDLHDIGKNLVVMMLKGAGFNVVDMGIDISPEKFVEEASKENSQIVGLSALLTTTMPSMKSTIEALKKAGCKVKTMIGGAPVTEEYAKEIGADGYAPDAASAVGKAKELAGI